MTTTEYFQQLGALTGRLWKERSCDVRSFPAAATRALADLPPNEHLSFLDAVRWVMLHDPLPAQNDMEAAFGQPPVTVFTWTNEFRIELLFWITGLPTIHQHEFSGAFHVLSGSSLHTEWRFTRRETIATALAVGDLTLTSAELLSAGQSRPIVSGDAFVHATFHLDRPSVTLVIRTTREKDQQPQYAYVPPGLAFDSEQSDTTRRRIQLLRMLRASARWVEYVDMLRHVLASTDIYTVLHIVMSAYLDADDEDQRADLLAVAEAKHRSLLSVLKPALQHLDRRQKMINLRSRIVDPELQFVLALLLNVDDRAMLCELMRQRFPREDPLESLVDSMSRLAAVVYPAHPAEALRRGVRSLLVEGTVTDATGGDSFLPTPWESWLFAPLRCVPSGAPPAELVRS